MNNLASTAPHGHLQDLLGFLESDPTNLSLLTDAASAAIADNRPDIATDMLTRYARVTAFGPPQAHLAALAAIQRRQFAEAAKLLRPLFDANPDELGIRFNLAWSLAMQRDFHGAQELLDKSTTDALPQAAALLVQMLHDQGNFDEAISVAKQALVQHPDHPGLLSVTSTLAIDVEDIELARACAERAGAQPEALATLGTLALGDGDPARALQLFEQALKRSPEAPRALVGKGLAQLSAGQTAEATANLRRGAELFDEHVGSWIAAGWAYLINNDLASAEACFQKSLSLDHNFAESHGSLAVVRILTGEIDAGRRFAQTASRLDPKSFAGALAQALLLSSEGKTGLAQTIIQRAMNTPIGAGETTLAKALMRHALKI